jgi:hypothetical protein
MIAKRSLLAGAAAGLAVLVLSCGAPAQTDRVDDASADGPDRPTNGSDASNERYEEPDWKEERRREAEKIEAARALDRQLADAKAAVDWARADVQRVEGQIREIRNDLSYEQQTSWEGSRSEYDGMEAEARQERARALWEMIEERQSELAVLEQRLDEAEDEHKRLKKLKAAELEKE